MPKIRIDSVTCHAYQIPLTRPFRISVGEMRVKDGLLFELRCGNLVGWGEASVDGIPFYTYETVDTALALTRRVFAPLLKRQAWSSPEELADAMGVYRGHYFTRAGLEAAFWDIFGQTRGRSIAQLLGGERSWVEFGPSLGIQNSPEKLVEAVGRQLEAGYRRIKIKVKPEYDEAYIAAVRKVHPDCTLMVDANSAYTPDDAERIASWDRFGLMMIEQPFDHDDTYFHRLLCEKMSTPICLDESIVTPHLARCALACKAADVVNIKVGRVGGLVNARRIHDICAEAAVPVWIGSRLSSGVAEAMRLAAASLPNALFPTDAGFSRMYLPESLLLNDFEIRNGCEIRVPDSPGLGVEIDRQKLQQFSVGCEEM